MQAYQATLARRFAAYRFLEEMRQSTQAPPATEDPAVVPRQRVAPLTQEAIIRAINDMTSRQLERRRMAAELAVLRLSLDRAPEDHRHLLDMMQRRKLEDRAARRPGPRALLALAGVFIAVGLALPATQAQARIVCFALAAVALSPLLVRPALDWLEDEADRSRPVPLPSFHSERARVQALESALERMDAGLPA